MTCKRIILLLALAGCADDVPVVEKVATAAEMVTLDVEQTFIPADLTKYRWELVTAPDGSVTGGPHGDERTSSFIPDVRGAYLVDRWLVSDLSERLTHHIVLTVMGVAPEASVRGDGLVSVGTTATLDGASSHSVEGRPLTYRWRLVARPGASQANLTSLDAAQTSLVPDNRGDYTVELAVFDGELWSELPATFSVMVP